jgi:hypothetical protein
MNKRRDMNANKENVMDKEIALTIGAVAIALINAMPDESYNAAVETLHRYASDETRPDKQRSLFGSIVHVLTAPAAQLSEEHEECKKRQRRFTVIPGGNNAA